MLEAEPSYVRTNGFGHEEWLFRNAWLLDGRRHSYLQPIGKYRDAYVGKKLDLLLYTLAPWKQRLFVGVLRSAAVPGDEELARVVREYREQGWLRQMAADCRSIGVSPEPLKTPKAHELINVSFAMSDVEFFDPPIRAAADSPVFHARRYHPLEWDGAIPKDSDRSTTPADIDDTDPKRDERKRSRAAQQGYSYDPDHVRIQNKVYEILCSAFGKRRVKYEHRCVDLRLDRDDGAVFFEVKTHPIARQCIREALGQLLEYSNYPGRDGAKMLVVVARAELTAEDKAYLGTLRKKYSVPVSYAQYDESKAKLHGWN